LDIHLGTEDNIKMDSYTYDTKVNTDWSGSGYSTVASWY